MSNGVAPDALSGQEDPIAAEFHQEVASARSTNNPDQRPGQCPIRFLDQHSPEEVAKYFENHKHEIPRSHQICVRRYQQNESSVRQLDAKYGNLVNMIQGLGVKHKAYLPERDRIEEQDSKSSIHAVEKWAENVSDEPAHTAQDHVPVADEEEPRVSRFEMPLREIRVGESPSRPWGISVPADKEPAPSALQSEEDMAHLKIESEHAQVQPEATKGKCPVDHGQAKRPHKTTGPQETANSAPAKEPPPQVIFNGPVFFGYPADQVATLLQTLNLGTAAKPGAG
jgi:hypothetical protein